MDILEKATKRVIQRLPLCTFGIIVLSIASSKINVLASLFIFDREAIFRGEVWRLLTAHFVHFGNSHLSYNAIIFTIIGWIIESKKYLYVKTLYFSMAGSISITLIIFKPDMAYFGGLSGIIYGAVVYCSLLSLHELPPWRKIGIFFLIFLLVKIFLETQKGNSLLPYQGIQGFVPMYLSHIAGSLTALTVYLLTNFRKPSQSIVKNK